MFGKDAEMLLNTLGLSATGEMNTAQLPGYLQRLKTAIEADKATNPVVWPEDLDTEADENEPVIVRFSQRATPMVQLMERCIRATETISW